MIYPRTILALCIAMVTHVAIGQPTYRISGFVGRANLTDRQQEEIGEYAGGWGGVLDTTDAKTLIEARRHLLEPLDPRWSMTEYVRSLYGRALRETFEPLLAPDNENEMAAVNALQVLSLLGTEQAAATLMHHADVNFEQRAALRHWASIGIGRAISSGKLPVRRIQSTASLLATIASREPTWYIASRQFDAMAMLHVAPNASRDEAIALQQLSFKIQQQALSDLIKEIAANAKPDDRMRAVRSALASLRLQLVEPELNATVRADAAAALLPMLVSAGQVALEHDGSSFLDSDLEDAYGGTLELAFFITARHRGKDTAVATDLRNAWHAGSLEMTSNEWVELLSGS